MNSVRPQTSTTAVVSLVFGVIAWFPLPLIGAIVAIITGHMARSEIRQAPPGDIEGDGLAIAGLVLGYAQLAFTVVAVVAVVLLFGGIAVLAALGS